MRDSIDWVHGGWSTVSGYRETYMCLASGGRGQAAVSCLVDGLGLVAVKILVLCELNAYMMRITTVLSCLKVRLFRVAKMHPRNQGDSEPWPPNAWECAMVVQESGAKPFH